MNLQERLAQDIKDAMRAKDQPRLLALRALRAAILEKEKEGTGPVTEEQLVAAVQKQAKQRRESIAQFEEAGREDLAQKERDELAVIERYLPAQLSDADIYRVVQDLVTRSGATSMKDMGRLMGEAMSELRGKADGNRVRQAVEALLKG